MGMLLPDTLLRLKIGKNVKLTSDLSQTLGQVRPQLENNGTLESTHSRFSHKLRLVVLALGFPCRVLRARYAMSGTETARTALRP
eukprot:1386651-Rhodomonas_salina.4